jgi:tetratricopeptide (TPR) repeat protein
MLRQFPAALKLCDRVLDITPNDADVLAAKASIYQAQGNLQEAASFLLEINQQTPSEEAFNAKLTQLRLQRNYGEVIRLLQARLAQFHFDSQYYKARDQLVLAWIQHFAGDAKGAKAAAEQAGRTLEQLYRGQPDTVILAARLSQAYAALGDKDSALKLAERAIIHLPRAQDAVIGPALEENLAFIQATLGEKNAAISILTQLLQTPYAAGWLYNPTPVTPELLRLEPFWDPLRGDPAFEKLCEDKQPVALK